MARAPETAFVLSDSCWTVIGVRGDASCPKLREHVHCRNCPVFSDAALALLDRECPSEQFGGDAASIAGGRARPEADAQSIFVFRLAEEWLALPTPFCREVTRPKRIHRVPGRNHARLLGLANVHGELLACVSLHHILGIRSKDGLGGRLLVLERDSERIGCPVDEAHGIARFHASELAAAPATLAQDGCSYTKAVLSWQDRTVGVLDGERLFAGLTESLASTPI